MERRKAGQLAEQAGLLDDYAEKNGNQSTKNSTSATAERKSEGGKTNISIYF